MDKTDSIASDDQRGGQPERIGSEIDDPKLVPMTMGQDGLTVGHAGGDMIAISVAAVESGAVLITIESDQPCGFTIRLKSGVHTPRPRPDARYVRLVSVSAASKLTCAAPQAGCA